MAEGNDGISQFQLQGIHGCYSLLGIPRNATSDQIKKAYRAKMLIHHEDKGGTKEMSQLLNKAYVTLSNNGLRAEYDENNDEDGDNIPGEFAAHAFLDVGELLSEKYRKKISVWQEEFQQFIITDNVQEFFRELFSDMLTDNNAHEFYECSICERSFVSSAEHYEMVLEPYFSRYDLDSNNSLMDTLRSEFGDDLYDWTPCLNSFQIGIWASDKWSSWETVRREVLQFIRANDKINTWSKLSLEFPCISDLKVVSSHEHSLYPSEGLLDSLKLVKCRKSCPEIKEGEHIAVTSSIVKLDEAHVPTYKIRNPAKFNNSSRCEFCQTILILRWHHCRICSATMCHKCWKTCVMFVLGVNERQSVCQNCCQYVNANHSLVWAKKALELMMEYKYELARAYVTISTLYANLNEIPESLDHTWQLIVDIAFSNKQYDIVFSLCCALKVNAYSLVIAKKLYTVDECDWALSLLALVNSTNWLDLADFFMSLRPQHPGVVTFCFEKGGVTGKGWADLAKRFSLAQDPTLTNLIAACVNMGYKSCLKSEWEEVVIDFLNTDHFQIALWALKKFSEEQFLLFFSTLVKKTSSHAIAVVVKYFAAVLNSNMSRLHVVYWLAYLQALDKCWLIEEMFGKVCENNISSAIQYAVYLHETGKYDFKSAIFEKLTEADVKGAMFCAKVHSLFKPADQVGIWFDLGTRLYRRNKEAARISFTIGGCDYNQIGDYFYERGQHQSALECYYSLAVHALGKICGRAEELKAKGDQNFLLYYCVAAKKIMTEQPDNIEQLTAIILEAFQNQDVLDKIFVAILSADFQKPVSGSSLLIHENFLQSRSKSVENITPEVISLCLAVTHILPQNRPSRCEFLMNTFPKTLKTNYDKAIYQSDFSLFGKCLQITTPRALCTIRDLLETYLRDRDISSCPPPFKCLMILLQGTLCRLENDSHGTIQKYHEALNTHPSFVKEVALCVVGQLKECHIHEGIYQNLINEAQSLINRLSVGDEIQMNEFQMICTRIAPPQLCKYAQFFGRVPVLTAVRKSEIQIEKRLQNTSFDAALSYVDLSIAAPDGSSTLGCFQMAITYLFKAMDESTENSLKYAYSKMIVELSFLMYFLGRKVLQPYMQWYTTRFIISTALKNNQKLAGALQGHRFGRNGETKPIVGSLQRNFLSEIVARHFYLTKVTPLYCPQVYSALDAIYLNMSSSEFLRTFYNTKLAHPYSIERFPIHQYSHEKFEAIWHGWIDNEIFEDARIACMHDILASKGWEMEDVQHIIEWPMVTRTNDGWLSNKMTPLDFELAGGSSFKSFCGFKVNMETGEVNLLLDSGHAIWRLIGIESDYGDLFSLTDIADIFGNGITFAHFSLEQPDKNMWSHPFQEAKYYPPSLSGTDYLSTLIHTDVLLKEFTTGMECSSKPPFQLRATSVGLLKRLPKHLAEIVAPLHNSRDYSMSMGDSAHRFWIDVTDIEFDVDQNESIVTYKFGKVKAMVKKQLQRRDAAGNLIDDESDTNESVEAKFATEFSERYDEFGKFFPELLRLKELAKISMACACLQGVYEMIEKQKNDLERNPLKFKEKVTSILQKAKKEIQLPIISQSAVDQIVDKALSKSGVYRWQVDNSTMSDLESRVWSDLREAKQTCITSIAKQIAEMSAVGLSEIRVHIEPWLNGSSKETDDLVRISSIGIRNKELNNIGKVLARVRGTMIKLGDHDGEVSLSNEEGVCAWVPSTFCTKEEENRSRRVYGGVAIRPSPQLGSVRESGRLVSTNQLKNPGRTGKQTRLRELANDPKLGSSQRGWIKQELTRIDRGQRKNIRNPPGTHLAHRRGFEAAKGFGYKYSDLQDINLHRTQHKHDKGGKANKTPSWFYRQNGGQD